MKFYLAVGDSGDWGTAYTTLEDAERDRLYCYSSRPVKMIFAASKEALMQGLYHDSAILKTNRKILVVPPLLDVRSNSKNFPSARRLMHCAIRGISMYSKPSVAESEQEEF